MSARSNLRGRWRRFALGLPTVLGLKPRGWFIPHRYAPMLPPPGAQPPYPAIERLFEEHTDQFAAVLDAVDARAAALGEWTHGAGRGVDNMVMVTLGTGIGIVCGTHCRCIVGNQSAANHRRKSHRF